MFLYKKAKSNMFCARQQDAAGIVMMSRCLANDIENS